MDLVGVSLVITIKNGRHGWLLTSPSTITYLKAVVVKILALPKAPRLAPSNNIASLSGRWPFANHTQPSWLMHFVTGTIRKIRKRAEAMETTVLRLMPFQRGLGLRLKWTRMAVRLTSTAIAKPSPIVSYSHALGVRKKGRDAVDVYVSDLSLGLADNAVY